MGGKKIIHHVFNTTIYPALRLYWFIFRPTTKGVKCIIQHGAEILLIRNTYGPGLWTFPGGGIKKGETLEAAARREVMEEVGITVRDLQWIGQFNTTSEYKRDTVQVFVAESDDKEFRIDPIEILEARWFDANQLPTMSAHANETLSLWRRKESIKDVVKRDIAQS